MGQNRGQTISGGSEAELRPVTISYLQMLQAPISLAPPLAADFEIKQAELVTPELVRWLYSVVGGPYHWTGRLGWSRQEWLQELADVGCEVWLLYWRGTPAGYCQLQAAVDYHPDGSARSQTEILYFGLMEWAQGRGAGSFFLEHMVRQAWTINLRQPLPPVHRIWVHTCSLDGPRALTNYRARGFRVYRTEVQEEIVLKQALTSWDTMFCR